MSGHASSNRVCECRNPDWQPCSDCPRHDAIPNRVYGEIGTEGWGTAAEDATRNSAAKVSVWIGALHNARVRFHPDTATHQALTELSAWLEQEFAT